MIWRWLQSLFATPPPPVQLDPYKEEYKESPNKGGKIAPRFIILHHTAGNFLGSVSWCLNPASKVSYHYIIDPRTGDRVQLVWDTRKAWHAGRSSYAGLSGLNSHSIGIAFHRNTHTREVADHEIDSCAWKCLYLMKKFDLERHAILTHQMIAPGRKDDCSPETFKRVLARVKELTS